VVVGPAQAAPDLSYAREYRAGPLRSRPAPSGGAA